MNKKTNLDGLITERDCIVCTESDDGTPLAASNENASSGAASRLYQDFTKRGARITFAIANSHCIDKHNFFQFKLQQYTMIKSTFQEVLARGNERSCSHYFSLIGSAMSSHDMGLH